MSCRRVCEANPWHYFHRRASAPSSRPDWEQARHAAGFPLTADGSPDHRGGWRTRSCMAATLKASMRSRKARSSRFLPAERKSAMILPRRTRCRRNYSWLLRKVGSLQFLKASLPSCYYQTSICVHHQDGIWHLFRLRSWRRELARSLFPPGARHRSCLRPGVRFCAGSQLHWFCSFSIPFRRMSDRCRTAPGRQKFDFERKGLLDANRRETKLY